MGLPGGSTGLERVHLLLRCATSARAVPSRLRSRMSTFGMMAKCTGGCASGSNGENPDGSVRSPSACGMGP